MKHKILLSLVAVLLTALSAQAYDFQSGDLYYNITSDSTVAVTYQDLYSNYSGLTSAIIPSSVTYNGTTYSVTSIGESAFNNCSGLTSITIPNSVTSIGESAFEDCSGLTSITIPNSVTSIGNYAFYGCSSLTTLTIGQLISRLSDYFSTVDNITSVTILEGVTSIGDRAFYWCSGLTSITIPNSVTSIGYMAFYGCSSLTSITIPNSVTSIRDYAFSNCSGLTSITIPNSVTSIGDYAFESCSSLTSITIPNSVTSIGDWAFKSCSGLTSITIPNSVTSIGDWAFRYCSGLTSITIPNSVTSIGNYAFDGCTGLTTLTIGQLISRLSDHFFTVDNITSVTILEGVTSIEDYAFYGCSSLTSITIPNSVTSIGESAFEDCSGLTSITIPNSVTSIGYWAFRYCSGLTSITIPNSVTSIGESAFYGCSGLTSITIPNSVTSIGEGAFSGCSGLTSITIPNSVTSIGDWAFSGCYSLTSINIENGNSIYDSRNNCNAIIETETNTLIFGCSATVIPNSVTGIGSHAFQGCAGLTSITIPNSVTSIGDYAFSNCFGLTSITIPNSVTSIGEGAFSNCSGLTSITIPNSVTSIGDWAFSNCSGLTSITIPNSVTSIGDWAFYGCSSLTSITIPNSVTNIGDYAFSECYSLTSITIPNSVTNIGSYAFQNCIGLTSVTIPNSVTSIGDYAFSNCYSLTSITIPNSVTNIGNNAFYGCTGLSSITIPNSVTSIGSAAFYGCIGLTSVTIGNSVTSIGSYAFSNCVQLTSITCEAKTPPSCDISSYSNSFKNIPANCTIKVPCGCLEAYNTAPWYNYQFAIIPLPSLQVQPSSESLGSTNIDQEVDCDNIAIISATANNGYHFVQWSDSITDNPRTIKLTKDTLLTAEFAKNSYRIYLTHDGEGTIEGDTTALYQDSVTLTAVADYGWQFSCWNDNNVGRMDNPRKVEVTGDCAYRAIFVKRNFTITTAGENGTITGSGTYAYETNCSLTATPNTGYHFVQWSDGVTENPRSIILTKDTNLTAEFAKNSYRIYLTHDGEGTIEGDTTALYQDSATLTAVADYGWQFSCWNDNNVGRMDNPRTIVVTADCEYHAIFVRQQFSLTAIAENGVVDGIGTFAYEDTCQLTATPNTGYHFVQWSDGITENPRTIVLTRDTILTAEFAKNSYQISTSHTGNGMTMGDTTALYQDTITLSALADYGWQFSGWEDGNTENPRVVVATEDKDYKAIFVKRMFTITLTGENGSFEGAGTHAYEDTCLLTATPAFGYHFAQWSDGVTDNPRSIILTQDTTLTAEFAMNYAGQCGDSLYWKYDTATISITGSGAMYNYTDSLMPWYLFRDSITAVEMVNTATSIGDNAFANCSKLSKLTIREGIESVGANAFLGCTQLTNITCYPTIPPYAETSSFANYDTYLRVPCISKSQYIADAVWGQFKYIECIEEETDIESVDSESTEHHVRKIYRDGNVYIIRDGEEYSILGQKL